MAGAGIFIIPSPQFSGSMGLVNQFTVPMVVCEGRIGISGEFVIPRQQFDGTLLRTGFEAIFNIPKPVFNGIASGPIHMSGTYTVPTPRFEGRFTIVGSGIFVVPMPIFGNFSPYVMTGEFISPLTDFVGFGRAIPISKIYRGIVVNLQNRAISTYSNFNFNSLAYFNGKYIGANEQGLFVLGGDKDNGQHILSKIKTGLMDFGSGISKYIRDIWLSYKTDGHMELTVYVDDSPDTTVAQTQTVSDEPQEEKLKIGRGLRGRFYTIELKNLSGSNFDIHELDILIDAIRRKTR